MRIVFEVAGDRQISREILRVGEHAADAAPAFSAIADYMMRETREQFASQGVHASGGWKPLAFSTIKRRGSGARILHDTGALERSLTERGGGDQILDVQPQQLIFGSKLPYARFHQTGTSRMPRRRPLEFTETARRNVVKILQRWVITGQLA